MNDQLMSIYLDTIVCPVIQVGAGFVVTAGSDYKGESLAKKQKQCQVVFSLQLENLLATCFLSESRAEEVA